MRASRRTAFGELAGAPLRLLLVLFLPVAVELSRDGSTGHQSGHPPSITELLGLNGSLENVSETPLKPVIVGSDWEGPLEFTNILPDPASYDKMHPPKTDGNATAVYFHVTVMSLDSIDESSMTYAADIFFAQSWSDHRLQIPDNITATYRLLPVAWLKDIWRPDSFFKNAKQVTFQEMTIPNHYIWLHQDKTILYMVKLTLVLSCAMNFKSYPHDAQRCAIKIESLSYTTNDLVFDWDPEVPLVVDHNIELPQLELIKTDKGDCTTQYSTGNFTCLEVVFTFKRRLGYYLFHTYIPTCLIVIMSWISFWIKPEAVPARVTLGVTSLLTLSTQHANSQKSLPPVSYIKAIDIFMSSCTVFVFLSLMEYALVNILMGDLLVDTEVSALARGVKTAIVSGKKIASHVVPTVKHQSKGMNSESCADQEVGGWEMQPMRSDVVPNIPRFVSDPCFRITSSAQYI